MEGGGIVGKREGGGRRLENEASRVIPFTAGHSVPWASEPSPSSDMRGARDKRMDTVKREGEGGRVGGVGPLP